MIFYGAKEPFGPSYKAVKDCSHDVQDNGVASGLLVWLVPHSHYQRHGWDEQGFKSSKKEAAREELAEGGACCHANFQDSLAENFECEISHGRESISPIRCLMRSAGGEDGSESDAA